MSTGKSIRTSTLFASKKLLGKAHTSNLKSDVNESIPSNVSLPSTTIFGEAIPNDPGTAFYTMYSASAGKPATAERIYLDVVSISDTIYNASTELSGGGGGESSQNGPHGYYLKLPANYETTSSNPKRGTGNFTNSKRVYNTRGGLQLIPPLVSNASPNRFFVKLYKGDPTNPANEITSGDTIDWQFDYYAGVIFIQDYKSATVPVTASAYLYVGDYLDTVVDAISGSSGTAAGPTNSIQIKNASGALTGSAKLKFASDVLKVDGGISLNYRSVSSMMTASVDDYVIGADSSGASFDIRLQSAASLNEGQIIVIKDEAGEANTNPVTIRAHGSQTIDGQNKVILQSSYAAIQLYCNGTDKYYIF